MLAKLITLPIASAIASASSQPPVLRIAARVMKTRKIAKKATTVSLPSASSHARRTVVSRGQLQMIADEQAQPRHSAAHRSRGSAKCMILKATMVQVGMK